MTISNCLARFWAKSVLTCVVILWGLSIHSDRSSVVTASVSITEADGNSSVNHILWNDNKIKIIDASFYNGENVALLRYYHIIDFVDHLVVAESLESFSGQRKTTFALDNKGKYFDAIRQKLIVIKIEKLEITAALGTSSANSVELKNAGSKCQSCRMKELRMRLLILDKIQDLMGENSKYIVCFAAAIDEIPRATMLAELPKYYDKLHNGALLEMASLIHNFNWEQTDLSHWVHSIVATDRSLASRAGPLFHVRRGIDPIPLNTSIITNAGWHCSNFLTTPSVDMTAKAFEHRDSYYPEKRTTTSSGSSNSGPVNSLRRYLGQYGYPVTDKSRDMMRLIPGYNGLKMPTDLRLRDQNYIFEIKVVMDPSKKLVSTKRTFSMPAIAPVAVYTPRNPGPSGSSGYIGSAVDINMKSINSVEGTSAKGAIKIIDITMYSGEPIALLRYYYLRDTVDYFFIVESLESFSGRFKQEYEIDKKRKYFDAIIDKLVVLKLDNLNVTHIAAQRNISMTVTHGQECEVCWLREELQRTILTKKIVSFMGAQQYIAIIADADEIPDTQVINELPKIYQNLHTGAHLEMVSLQYNFRWFLSRKLSWRKAFVVTDRTIMARVAAKDFNFMEDIRRIATRREHLSIIHDAGWHCSYFMSVEDIQKKIAQFSHQEYNIEKYTSTEVIARAIKRGENLYNLKYPIMYPYYGRYGYPLPCRDCSSLPDFGLFQLPPASQANVRSKMQQKISSVDPKSP